MRSMHLEKKRLGELLSRIAHVRAAVVGDVCLDAYWIADMRRSALSRETPHHNLPVVEERYALGGAGNVIGNMCALGAQVYPVTALGDDWRGGIVRSLMDALSLVRDGLIVVPGRVTPTYVKPYRCGYGGVRYEDPRIDFENALPLPMEAQEALVDALLQAAAHCDVVAVSDQMAAGVVAPRVREALCALCASGKTVIVDSRERVDAFVGCIIKPNELEAARASGMTPQEVTPQAYLPVAEALSAKTGAGVIVTLGAAGAMCLSREGEACFAPGVRVPPPVDIVGAGDSFLSACALALGAGAALGEAIALGNLASAVTIQKLGQTGTASAQEICAQYDHQNADA